MRRKKYPTDEFCEKRDTTQTETGMLWLICGSELTKLLWTIDSFRYSTQMNQYEFE